MIVDTGTLAQNMGEAQIHDGEDVYIGEGNRKSVEEEYKLLLEYELNQDISERTTAAQSDQVGNIWVDLL